MTSIRKLALVLLIAPLFVLPFGCGGSKLTNPGKLSGRVTYKGAPVTGGLLVFHAPDKSTFQATIHPDGTFAATDLGLGEMKVTVSTELLNPKLKDPKGKVGGSKGAQVGYRPGEDKSKGEGTYVPIPQPYRTVSTTPLTVTIVAGDQTKNFELTD